MALADQSFAQLVGILQVLWEMFIMMLPLVLLLEYGHGITGIVGELIGVAGIECFAMAEILLQLLLACTKQYGVVPFFHGFLGNVHGENHGSLLLTDGAAPVALLVVVVGEVREDESLQEQTCLACGITEIDRRTDDDHICLAGCVFVSTTSPYVAG